MPNIPAAWFQFEQSNPALVTVLIMCRLWYIVADETLYLSLLVVANFGHAVCTVGAGKHEQTERPLAESPLC